MHATLPAGKTAIDAIAPRQKTERHLDVADKSTKRHDDFASRLDEARSRSAQDEAPDVKSDKPQPSTEAKPHDDAKPVDHAKPRDDARQNDGDGQDESAATSAPKKPTAEKSAEASSDDAEDRPDETIVEVKKPQDAAASAADAEAQAAWAAAMQVAQTQQATTEQANAEHAQSQEDVAADAIDAAAIVATAAAATQAMNADALAGEEDADAATGEATSTDAVAALKLQSVDGEEKSAKPQQAAAKPETAGDLAAVATAADAAPKRHGPQHGQQDQPKQQQEAPAAMLPTAPEGTSAAKDKKAAESTFDEVLAKLAPQEQPAAKQVIDRPAPTPAMPPEKRFASDNVENVVKSVRTQLDAGGGQMKMRLDPPELGALEVAVKMVDGRMTASFTTSNEQATHLLSHSLNDLKQSLEASGISVDRIQVRQSSADNNAQQQPGEHKRDGQSSAFDQHSGRSDQQRRDQVEKMWRKLAYGSDELDFVA